MLRSVADPFSPDGGLRVLHGNLGRSVVKTSAVEPDHRVVEAPAVVFDDQDDLLAAFAAVSSTGATWSPSSATRARVPTACPSCTS